MLTDKLGFLVFDGTSLEEHCFTILVGCNSQEVHSAVYANGIALRKIRFIYDTFIYVKIIQTGYNNQLDTYFYIKDEEWMFEILQNQLQRFEVKKVKNLPSVQQDRMMPD